jgi:ribosomal protein L16/L10AE
MHKGRRLSFQNGKLIRSRFGLIACSYGLITQRQFETIRRFISRRIRKKSKYFRRTSLDLSTTKKSSKARMGKGCGRFFR